MEMWPIVLAFVCLIHGTYAVTFSFSLWWLNTDGIKSPVFDEGDTAIYNFKYQIISGELPINMSVKVERKRDNNDNELLADGNDIIMNDDDHRFQANMVVEDKTVYYNFTIGRVTRYDEGKQYFVTPDKTGNVQYSYSDNLQVNWNPPSPECAFVAKAEIGQSVTYHCTAVDSDMKSVGSLTMWNSNTKLTTVDTQSSDQTQYPTEITYDAKYTTEFTGETYVCRYKGTGGYRDYEAESTCGAAPLQDHLVITLGLSILATFWAAMGLQ